MTTTAMRRPAALLAFVAAATSVTCSDVLETGEPVRTTIGIDLSALRTSPHGRLRTATVLEEVRLMATPEDGQPRTWAADAAEQTVLTFDVVVPAGNVDFVAEVTSNNGATLYRGATSATIRASGFSVAVDLQAVNAVMIVVPDTIDVRRTSLAQLLIRNAGTLPLSWAIAAPCDNNVCVRVDPATGRITPGGQLLVTVQGFSRAGERIVPLQVTSNVGTVDVTVIVPPLPPVL
jgi:hypothetical protein